MPPSSAGVGRNLRSSPCRTARMRLGSGVDARAGGCDDARADHASAVVVEHGGLSRSHAVDRFAEQQAKDAGALLDPRGNRRGAPAELGGHARRALLEPPLAQLHLAAGEARARADDELVSCRVRAQDVQRLWRREAEPLALPRRVGRRARMQAELVPRLVADAPLAELHALALEELAERAAAEEAHVLALAGGRSG